MDNIVGTAGDDTINAPQVATLDTFTGLDAIDGGDGKDTLNVYSVAAVTAPASATVKNVETVNLSSASTVAAVTSLWTGLNTLNVTAATTSATLTAAATTDVVVGGVAGSVTVDGGKGVSVTAAPTTSSITVGSTAGGAGAVNVTHAAQGANIITVDGGTTVNVTTTATGANTGLINVGSTGKGASGVVTVNSTLAAPTANQAGGTITVKGGSEVNVIQVAIPSATSTVTNTQSNVVISNDGKNTISKVLVAQTAPAAAVTGVSGAIIAATSVGITDLNTATKPDTITTVTLDRAAPTTITGNALTTLNVKGDTSTGAAGNAITFNASAGLAPAVGHLLTMNLTGGAIGTVTDSQTVKFGAITINGNSAATTISNLSSAALGGLSFGGDAKVTITTLSSLVPVAPATTTLITSTNTAGVKIGSGLAVTTGFTGGTGADEITIGATTQTISMGAGNDTVTITANAAAGGSVAGGDGTDTLVGTDAALTALAADSTALARYSGFEVVKVSDAAANGSTIDATLFGATSVVVAAGVTATKTTTLAVGANATVTLAGALNTATGTLSFSAKTNTTTDAVTLVVNSDYTDNNDTTADAIARTATVTATSIENLTVQSTGKMAAIATLAPGYKADVVTNTLALTDTDLTTLTVTGDQKLVFASANAQTKLASIDASANTAGVSIDASLATNNATAIPAAQVALMTIKGSATGVNTLTGTPNADVIVGGAKDDTIKGGKGADTLTGNGGNDLFDYSGATAGLSTFGPGNIDTITDFVANTYGAGTGGALNGKGAAAAATPSVWTGDVIKITAKGAAATDVLKFYVAANTTDALAYIQTNAAAATNVVVLDASASNLYIENGGADNSADLVIHLTGVTTLTEAAILLV